jgi:hypothetical protein
MPTNEQVERAMQIAGALILITIAFAIGAVGWLLRGWLGC